MDTPKAKDAPDVAPRGKGKAALLWWVVAGLVLVALFYVTYQKYQEYLARDSGGHFPIEVQESRAPVIGEGGVSVREAAGCSNKLPWDKRSEVQQVSRDGEHLVVQVLANASCGRRWAVSPSAKLVGTTMTLEWAWEVPKGGAPPAACLCTHHLEFRVPGVSPGELTVQTAPPDH